MQNNLASGWSVTGEDIGPFTATSPNGNVFTVDKDGTITGQNGGTQTPGGDEPEDPEVPEEPETPTVTLPEELKVGKEFTMDADQDGTEETWIVLYDSTAEHLNENEIEVISKDTMGSLTLGADDTVAIENAIDLDGNDTVEDIEIAIYSYNNAIDRINNYCESLIKIGNLGVRSVGSLPSNPSYKNTSKPYAIQNLDKWTNQTAWNTYGVLGEDTDTNLNDDYTQMNTLGIMQSGNTKGYWLASRSVGGSWDASSSFGYVNFYVRNMSSSGNRGYYNLWSVYSSGSTNTANTAYAVRPVVKLQYP